jgi:hypothetical protein
MMDDGRRDAVPVTVPARRSRRIGSGGKRRQIGHVRPIGYSRAGWHPVNGQMPGVDRTELSSEAERRLCAGAMPPMPPGSSDAPMTAIGRGSNRRAKPPDVIALVSAPAR